ncbi:HAMP domain-containing histidine kinase [Ruminococcaceae bacterium OttesenSCG-928-O06]|nr:HAMP domain-containing histidine kinase [Ruminococcaceae bacterium OttesenSCG-928-O06]
MKSRSIRYYFFTSITTVLVASVLVMGLIQSVLATNYFRDDKLQQMRQAVTVIASNAKLGSGEYAGVTSTTINTTSQMTGAIVFVADPKGTVLYSIGRGAPQQGSVLPGELMEQLGRQEVLSDMGPLWGIFSTNHYYSTAPMRNEAGQLRGYAFAAADASTQLAYLANTLSTFVLSAAVVLVISSILALVLSNRTVIPLRRITDAAHRFAEGDYSARVPVEGGDELAALSVTFNDMANSIEAIDTSRRSFMGNIAHELRTPMTTIKGFIDGMLDGTIPVEQRDRYLMVVSDEVGRLARLTKNMLDISRLEAGEYTANNVVFDVWASIATVLLAAEQRLLDKGLKVQGMEHEQPAWVLADEDFVHQVLYNLVDNAIKFAEEGGTLTLSVATAKNTVTVGVRNTGSGIPADALPHVFDRFYKADKSRGVNARGAGLGLHISKVLLGLMGGRIWAESHGDDWTEFLFTLPAAAPKRGKARPEAKTPRQNGKPTKNNGNNS